jgi:ATP phosphoribosyltransferase
MSDRVNQAAAAFRALSHEERLKVIRTVPESEQRLIVEGLSEDEENAEGWTAELMRRAQEAHAGTSKTSSVDEHLDRLRARLLK